jgi:hypothetical protein
MKACPAREGDYFEFFAEIGKLNFLTALTRPLGRIIDLSCRKSGIATLGT